MSEKSNAAMLIRLYPNKQQEMLLTKCCLFRFRYYKALALWWNSTYKICCQLYKDFCEKEIDEQKRKEYSKTLPWPPKKVSKEGLNDTCLKVVFDKVPKYIKFACTQNFTDKPKKGKFKGIDKNYGDVFRINAVYMPTIYGNNFCASSAANWCKDNFAQSVTKTFSKENIEKVKQKNKERIAKGLKPKPCPPTSIKSPKFKDVNTFKVSVSDLNVQRNKQNNNKITKINIPFLSGEYRKKYDDSIEWISCSLSDLWFEKINSVSAITIKKNGANQWYAALNVNVTQTNKKELTGKECGIDLGIKTTATIAANIIGEQSTVYDKHTKQDMPIEKIKTLEEKKAHLQKIQNRRIKTWVRLHKDKEAKGLKFNTGENNKDNHAVVVYKKYYQSKSFVETEKRIAKIDNDIANIRKEFSEQFSHNIAKNYDAVGLEDLNVKGMTKNHKIARSIERIGFYKIRKAIERKVGKDNVVYINRFAPSSQTCSHCGFKNKKVKNISVREWTCPQCGCHHDRDENAASNIRPSAQKICEKYIDNKGK